MNMRAPQNKIKWRDDLLRSPFNSNLLIIAILVAIAALVIVFGVRAIEAVNKESGALIKVPGDYPTIQAAIDAASAGDIIQVAPGVYTENLILNKAVSLTASSFDQVNPVNNQAIIDGGTKAAVISIPAGLTQMPSIRGFTIRNGTDGIQAASEFIAEYDYLTSADNLVSYQLGAGGTNRNNIYHNARANAIRLDNMNRPLVIEGNRMLYNAGDGIEISLQNSPIPPAVVEIDIWNNMILGSGADGIQLIDHPGDPQDTNRRFVIAYNLIANNKKAGLGLMPNANAAEDFTGAAIKEAVRVYNNTLYGNDYGISGGENLVAFNNIIANSPSRGARRVQGPPGVNAVVAYTLFHNNRIDQEQTTLGVGNILGQDPLFEAAPNPGPDGAWGTLDDDFSGLVLQPNSPAIDKGVIQYTASNGEAIPPNPITGFAGAAPDLGWREFGSPIFITPTPTLIASPTPLPTFTPVTLSPVPTTTSVTASPSPTAATTTTATASPESPTPTSTTTALSATPTATVATAFPAVTATATTQLTIQGIDPTVAQANTTVTMTIVGSGFQTGAVVAFEGGQGAPQEILAVQVVNPTTIVITMTAHNDGAQGAQVWDVRVTNPDNSTVVLAEAFTVVPR
jgi:cell division septation protein DedD